MTQIFWGAKQGTCPYEIWFFINGFYLENEANVVAHTLAGTSRLHAHHQQFDLIPYFIETLLSEIIWDFDCKKKNT